MTFYVATAGLLSRRARRLARTGCRAAEGKLCLHRHELLGTLLAIEARYITYACIEKCSARSSVRGSFRQPRMCPSRSKHATANRSIAPSDKLFRCPANERSRTEKSKASLCARRQSVLPRDYFSMSRNATASFCNLSLIFSASVLEMSIALPSGAVAAISLCPAK